MDSILYDKFILNDKYKNLKGEGGNDLYEEMLKFIKEINNEEEIAVIKKEIYNWLLIGRSSYFIMAVNFIGDLNLVEYKPELKRLRIEIIKKHIPDFPEYFIDFIDESIKRIA